MGAKQHMKMSRKKLLVTLVLLSALMAVVGSQAEARPGMGWSSNPPATTLASSPTSTPDSGEPDVGQGKGKWRPAAGTQPGFTYRSFPGTTGIMWIRWAGAMWAARYLGLRF